MGIFIIDFIYLQILVYLSVSIKYKFFNLYTYFNIYVIIFFLSSEFSTQVSVFDE